MGQLPSGMFPLHAGSLLPAGGEDREGGQGGQGGEELAGANHHHQVLVRLVGCFLVGGY